ncbi:MAG TPA: SHOCT domain-containing protein [Acidimicrobiales bacterium]
MGLIRGMARTAVVAGTATAVSNRVSRRQAERWQRQDYEQQAQYAAPPPPDPVAPPAAPAAGGADMSAGLERLATLRNQGVLTDEEFAAAKAKLLGL